MRNFLGGNYEEIQHQNVACSCVGTRARVLARCLRRQNDGGGDKPTPPPTPAEYTSQEYFTNLWNLSKGIGSEAIAANDNLAVHADLSLALATESNAGKVYQKVDLGFSIDLVLDKSAKAATSESQTALKVRVYDPTDNETWVTLTHS